MISCSLGICILGFGVEVCITHGNALISLFGSKAL